MNVRTRVAAVVLLAVAAAGAARGADFLAGDRVTVKAARTPIKLGNTVLGWLAKGQKVRIFLVSGGFAKIAFTGSDGKRRYGFVSLRDLNKPARPVKPRAPATSPYDPGDAVMVVAKEAKLMMGKAVLGAIPMGTRLVVKKVKAPWLGVYATVGGKRTWGWLHQSKVDYAALRQPKKDDGAGKQPGR